MIRRTNIAVGSLIAATVLMMPLLLTSAAASASTVQATGDVTCAIIGSLHFSPALTYGGTATTDTVKVKIHLSGCNTSDSSNVTSTDFSGHGAGTFITNSDNCAHLAESLPLPFAGNMKIAWTARIGVHNVGVTYLRLVDVKTFLVGTYNGNPGFTFPYTPGSATATGSFAGPVSGEVDDSLSSTVLAHDCGFPGFDPRSGTLKTPFAASRNGRAKTPQLKVLNIGAGRGTAGMLPPGA